MPIELIEAEEIIPITKKEPAGARPIIPKGDTCCVPVCTTINAEIDALSRDIKIRQDELKILAKGPSKISARRGLAAITNQITSLKDLRFTLAEKGACKCVETPKFPEKKIP